MGRLKSFFFILMVVVLMLPGIKILFSYFQNYGKSYSLEITKNMVTRYAFNPNDRNAFLRDEDVANKIGQQEVSNDNEVIEQYYDEVYSQYGIDEGLVEDYRSNQKENIGIENSFSSPIPVVGDSSGDIITGLNNKNILYSFIDQDQTQKEDISSEEEELLNRFEKEGKDLELFVNDDFIQTNQGQYARDPQSFILSTITNFKPSPRPKGGKNTTKELNKLKIEMSKKNYYSFEVMRYNIVAQNSININDLIIYVMRDNYIFPNVDGKESYFVYYDNDIIYGSVSLGYRPPPGVFEVVVKSKSNPNWKGVKTKFSLLRRQVPPLKKGFSVMNMEYTTPVNNRRIMGPYGDEGGYEKIAEWSKYIGVDAFWTLVAQTTGWDSSINVNSPWVKGGFRNFNLLAPEMKKRGIEVGAYVMAYYTPGNGKKKISEYTASLGYDVKTDMITDSLHISLLDKKRLEDIIQFASSMDQNTNVDYIGLDFIRTGEVDGYEMVNMVVNDMNISTPKNYEKYSFQEKVKWFGRQIKIYRNPSIIAKWRWWRASQVAHIVNTIITEGRIKKPLWVFTLGWEHGLQHGQDPYMMFDAGAFINAAMLYEASEAQFRNMMIQWRRYMKDNNNNVIIGNSSDYRLLDSSKRNIATEFIYRNRRGYQEAYSQGLAKGIFLHDIYRALWSKNKGISTLEWAIVYGHSISAFRHESGVIPYYAELGFEGKKGYLKVENRSKKTIKNLSVEIIPTLYWSSVKDDIPSSFDLKPGENKVFHITAIAKRAYRNRDPLLAYNVKHREYPQYFVFTQKTTKDFHRYIYSRDK